MIPKALEEITEADFSELVNAGVEERKTIDYKQQLPTWNDSGKRELLADVSSFANTAGGDLVFGITESGGSPMSIPGVEIADPDQEVLRIDNIIRDGLSPRIRQVTKAILLASTRYVVVIRTERSWYGPHRLIFRGDSRFYGRTSNGKYELDVTDLRNAFILTNTVSEKMTAFRSERVIALANGQALTPVVDGPKLVLHALPVESFGTKAQFDVLALQSVQPMYTKDLTGFGQRINFDGTICKASGEPTPAYTQVFRNGVIEAVRVGVLSSGQNPDLIPSRAYEEAIVNYIPHCFEIIRTLGCRPPIFIAVSLIGVRGRTLALGLQSPELARPIDRDVLLLPEVVAEDLAAEAGPLIRPILDLVWNASGIAVSPNFDENGHWRGA